MSISPKDELNLHQKILDFPKQFREGMEAAKFVAPQSSNGAFSNLIIAGMGGSSLPGQMFKTVNRQNRASNLPIIVHQNYGLPEQSNPDSLVVCISYSGNTEETLSAFQEACLKKSKIITMGTGGKLAEMAEKNGFPHIFVPVGFPPRIAIGYMFSALAKALSNLGAADDITGSLLPLEENLIPENLEGTGKEFIDKLMDKIPLIYCSEKWEILGKIWKINFNETAEVPSFFSILPDLNHHEMSGFTDHGPHSNHKDFRLLILSDPNDDSSILKRMRVTSELLGENEIYSNIISLEGKNVFEKMFSNIILSYWVSYYLASEYNIEPSTARLTEEFKKRL